MHSQTQCEAIQTILLSTDRLESLQIPAETRERLLEWGAIYLMRSSFGEDRVVLVGFIGCTGTGKSTLFNSLVNQEISLTGWQSHNTSGPVLLAHASFRDQVESIESHSGKLLFPTLKRNFLTSKEKTFGSPDSVQWLEHQSPEWKTIALLDLPDINTTLARDEKHLAIRLLPWLDTVIFMVDDETIYHREYEEAVSMVDELGPARLCVLNHRGMDRVDLSDSAIKETIEFFGVDTIHVLPRIKRGNYFTRETEFQQLKKEIQTQARHTPPQALWPKIQPLAHEIMTLISNRNRIFTSLENNLDREIRHSINQSPPLELKRIIHDDVLQALNHLGLKRFALTNILQFFRRVTSTGSLRKSFQVAFSGHRDQVLSQLLHIDLKKLEEETHKRLVDHNERIRTLILQHPQSDSLLQWVPELRDFAVLTTESLKQALEEDVRRFEKQCQEILANDQISGSVKNDPLVTAGVCLFLIADVFTIPGFGGFALAPSLFRYLPLGPFEKAKRRFLRNIDDRIRQTLLHGIQQLNEYRQQIVLDEHDPLYQALVQCGKDHET